MAYRNKLAKAAGGWKEVVKFKDKNGNWVTRTIWGSGAAGFSVNSRLGPKRPPQQRRR